MSRAFAVLYVPLAVSIAGLVSGAANGQRLLAGAAAALGAVFLALSAVVANLQIDQRSDLDGARHADRERARANASVLAVGWAWAGVSMLAVYLLSGLSWRHGWQYGSGMLLVSALILAYAHALADPTSALASPAVLRAADWTNTLQALAASLALAWLVHSGKLSTDKGDWAANDIFLAGGGAIIALAVIARLSRRRSDRAHS